MNLSHEDVVTALLSKCEIINKGFDLNHKMYVSNPLYNLTQFLEEEKNAPSRWGAKYVFVK